MYTFITLVFTLLICGETSAFIETSASDAINSEQAIDFVYTNYYLGLNNDLPRTRRHAEDTNLHDVLKPCCEINNTRNKHAEQYHKECYTEVVNKYQLYISDEPSEPYEHPDGSQSAFSPDEENVFNNKSLCLSKCKLEKLKAVDPDGNLNPSDAINYMKSIISLNDDNYWATVKEKCMKGYTDPEKYYICKPDAMDFEHCCHFLIDLYCPENLQRKTTRCVDYREHLKKMYLEEK